jgi:hypothetical protein
MKTGKLSSGQRENAGRRVAFASSRRNATPSYSTLGKTAARLEMVASASSVGAPSVELLSKPAAITALEQRASSLLKGLRAIDGPRFFLSSLNLSKWIPRVTVIKRGDAIVGLVYAKERKLAGLPTGMLVAHGALEPFVVAAADRRESVLETALESFLSSRRVRGIRLMVPPRGFEMVVCERIASLRQMDISRRPDSNHQVVPLESSYEAFLNSVSYKTRRNMRYYRRRYETAGHRYVSHLNLEEFGDIVAQLLKRTILRGSREGVTRALRMIAGMEKPLLAGLRRADGEWVAILGGWQEGDTPIVVFQMNNDRDYSAESLSTVLRSYFIEELVADGCGKLVFWAGVAGPLARRAQPFPSLAVYLDVGDGLWRYFRRVCAWLAPHLPPDSQMILDWVSPDRESFDSLPVDLKPKETTSRPLLKRLRTSLASLLTFAAVPALSPHFFDDVVSDSVKKDRSENKSDRE